MAKKKSIVALAKGTDAQENVTKVFDLLGGVTNIIKPGETVILKPNAGHEAPPESSVDTSPAVVRAVIREVKKANPGKIIVAEAAAIGCDTMKCFEASGIADVCRKENVEMYDIKSEKDLINIPVRGYRSNISHVKLPRRLIEAEHIINLPILKAHASMVFSCALKNIKGVVQDRVHMDMHAENLTMAMMDVWYAARADINIVDAMNAAGGYSPHMPVPLEVNCVLGSFDPVAADRVASEIVGIDSNLVDYFSVAEQVGLGATNLDDIEVIGETIENCYKKMWVPYLGDMSTRWPEYDVRCKGACSSCQALLAVNMEQLKPINEYYNNTDYVIVAGKLNEMPGPEVPDEKILLHGNCTRKYLKERPNALFMKGCPPAEGCIYHTIASGELMDAGTDERVQAMRARGAKDHPVWEKYVFEQAEKFYKEAANETYA